MKYEKSIPAQRKSNIADVLDRLIQLAVETNKPDEVVKWKDKKAKWDDSQKVVEK